eukprot:5936954-Amphidinium_carterae.1
MAARKTRCRQRQASALRTSFHKRLPTFAGRCPRKASARRSGSKAPPMQSKSVTSFMGGYHP